jgi:hypothetical protein
MQSNENFQLEEWLHNFYLKLWYFHNTLQEFFSQKEGKLCITKSIYCHNSNTTTIKVLKEKTTT